MRTEGLADIEAVIQRARRAWRPPPKLTVSAWADLYYQLSPENSAVPGQWTTLPYQREPLDAMGDSSLRSVAIMKSARVGYTRMLLALLGYRMHQDPAPCLVVQPTKEDVLGFSKDDLQPMIRDTPVLTKLVYEDKQAGDAENTLAQLRYPGGVVSLVGAHSGTGFRRISRKVIATDEVDAYPVLIGEGDVIKLAQKRSEYYHDRTFCAGSTPLIAGSSRIEAMFEEGDQRRYFVPCPQCQHMAPLTFKDPSKGHVMTWDEGNPWGAFFVCQKSGCVIEHSQKRWMVERGEWRPTNPNGLPGHRSYHMWAALSYSPGATWGDIAAEFVQAKSNTELLRVFVNTTLGETWKERGEAPDWERLYQRRESYEGVPDGVLFLTAGVDVQKDRLVYEVVGWGNGKRSWSIEADVIPGRPEYDETWKKLDALLNKTWDAPNGGEMSIRCLAVDSGYNANTVYNWARQHSQQRVIATKGQAKARTLISTPSPVDLTVSGKRIARGYKVWIVGVDVAKAELYGWLKLNPPTDEEQAAGYDYPNGYCHFPMHGDQFFKQLTAEHLVSSVNKRTGFTVHEWQLIPGRENHWLDCRVYARAAAARLGLDRVRVNGNPQPAASSAPAADVTVAPQPRPQQPSQPRSDSRLRRGSGFEIGSRAKGWLGKRR